MESLLRVRSGDRSECNTGDFICSSLPNLRVFHHQWVSELTEHQWVSELTEHPLDYLSRTPKKHHKYTFFYHHLCPLMASPPVFTSKSHRPGILEMRSRTLAIVILDHSSWITHFSYSKLSQSLLRTLCFKIHQIPSIRFKSGL